MLKIKVDKIKGDCDYYYIRIGIEEKWIVFIVLIKFYFLFYKVSKEG